MRKSELAPYVKLAEKYIQQFADHEGVADARHWCERFIYTAPPGPEYASRLMTGDQRLCRWLKKLAQHGVTGARVLAVVIALYLYRESNPLQFVSDGHWRAILAWHVLRLAPAPRMQTWGAGTSRLKYDRIGQKLRSALTKRIENNIGVACLLMARALTTPQKDYTKW
jgi:hypothetical protein